MTVSRALLSALLMLCAALLQITVINRLPLPGTGPDLVLLIVIGLAMVSGPTPGAVTGFAAGLLVDLMPPTATEVGLWAFVYCCIGYLAGQVQVDARRSAVVVLATVGALSAAAVGLYAAIALLFGDSRVTVALFVSTLVSTVLYDLLLAPFVIPGVMALARRTAVNSAVL
jgi:rod shape-determining protein MreD